MIEGIEIQWELGEMTEIMSAQRAIYTVYGVDQFGKEYIASTETYRMQPEIEDLQDIEEWN